MSESPLGPQRSVKSTKTPPRGWRSPMSRAAWWHKWKRSAGCVREGGTQQWHRRAQPRVSSRSSPRCVARPLFKWEVTAEPLSPCEIGRAFSGHHLQPPSTAQCEQSFPPPSEEEDKQILKRNICRTHCDISVITGL